MQIVRTFRTSDGDGAGVCRLRVVGGVRGVWPVRSVGLSVAALVLVVVVAGCSGGSASAPVPSRSAPSRVPVSGGVTPSGGITPSGATTPSVTDPVNGAPPAPVRPTVPADVPTTGPNTRPHERPPVEPLEATQHTPAGAAAFAEFFIRTIDWGYATINGNYVKDFSTASCVGCRIEYRGFSADAAAGKHYVGGRTIFPQAEPTPSKLTPHTWVVTVDITPFEILDARHKFVLGQIGYKGVKWSVQPVWQGTAWRTASLTVEVPKT